jgi:ATP-dependent exoDNAse (exonuclease V) beta subunit
LLVSANAGSGKTSVLVHRYVAAVLEDGLSPAQILAITFTDRAAGEMRERIRELLLEHGAREAAREAEAAFVLTVHGFCARVLRSDPWAAGLDPTFSVLDERAANGLSELAFRTALAELLGEREQGPELDLVAGWGLERVRATIVAVHERLRSRGIRSPTLPDPGPVSSLAERQAALAAARDALAAELGRGREPAAKVEQALQQLEISRALLDALTGDAPAPLARLVELRLIPGNASALQSPAAAAYADALSAYLQACADRRGADSCLLLDRLLRAYADAYAEAKRARGAVDFDDLELGARDMLRDDRLRRAWAERFELLMVDEFQDINPRQLEILKALERDNLFSVGDECQSIYGFRHADVTLFRERRDALSARGATARLARNFRGRPELLDAINAAFIPILGDAFVPLEPGRAVPAAGGAGEPRVELMITDTQGWDEAAELGLGAGLPEATVWRQAEARLVAQRLDELVRAGDARPGDIAVLVRAASDLAVYERALEQRGLPTLAAAGRGYWSRQQVQDLTSYLAVVANPLDEGVFYGLLASPLGGLSSDGLAAVAMHAREHGGGAWAAAHDLARSSDEAASLAPGERVRLGSLLERLGRDRGDASRLPLAILLARAVREARYDDHVLDLRGGRRRLANIEKLLRLAAQFESHNGRDLRGFLAHVAAEGRREAGEADAPAGDGEPEAIQLMTIHAAKGLEFPVVCVADLGRAARSAVPWLLVDGSRLGVKVTELGMAGPVEALDYHDLRERVLDAEDREERRIVYVAVTRARERLLLSGAADPRRWPNGRRGGPPVGWLGSAFVPDLPERLLGEEAVQDVASRVGGFQARVRVRLNSPGTLGQVLRIGEGSHPADVGGTTTPGAAAPAPLPPEPRPEPATESVPAQTALGLPAALSYTALAAHARCGYRFYVQRVLGLPDAAPPPALGQAQSEADARMRGTLVHAALETIDFSRPSAPSTARVRSLARGLGWSPKAADLEHVIALIESFAASPMCGRLAGARSVRREHPFVVTLASPAGPGQPDPPILTGAVDVLAEEEDHAWLVVDYKSDRLGDVAPETLIESDYRIQRSVYALAVLRAGAESVEVAHCFLERPEPPVSARFTSEDLDRLEAELGHRAGELLQGRFAVTDSPHLDLCATCPARRRLCSWDEARTLRPQAAPSLRE